MDTRAAIEIEALEPRRLCAAGVTITRNEAGVIIVVGTGGPDNLAIAEHFPGVGIFEVVANGERRNQYTSNTTAFRIYGRGGSDVIHIDVIESITLPAFLFGGPGADTISGGAGDDVLVGGAGADAISGRRGADDLSGGAGDDVFDGGDGNDRLSGGGGRDALFGGGGDDIVSGGPGADRLDGGEGSDTVTGGRARDLLTGGPGPDVFSVLDGPAEIQDLLPGDIRR